MSEHPKKVVLLDLDGTLTKSDPGIIGCVVKAFQEMGYPVPDADELQRFIGPAISESMQRNGVPDDELDKAVTVYRKYYADEAVFDDPNNPGQKVPGRLNNTIYKGIPEQLARLRISSDYRQLQAAVPVHSDLRAFPSRHHGRWHLWSQQGQFASRQGSGNPLGVRAYRLRRIRRRQSLDGRRSLDRCRRCQGMRFGLLGMRLGLR